MSEPSQPSWTELEAKLAELQHDLDNLTKLAGQGLPVTEALAQVEQQVADLEHQLAVLQDEAPLQEARPPTFDQQDQKVGTQILHFGHYLIQATSGDKLLDRD